MQSNLTEEGYKRNQDFVNISEITEETRPNIIVGEHDTPRKIKLKQEIRRLEFKNIENIKK